VFTNRNRMAVTPILMLLLAALMGWWSWLQHDGRVGYHRMTKRPLSMDGQQVVLSLVEVIAINGADLYEVEQGSAHFEVRGPTAGLVLGEEVSVGGLFHASGARVDEAWRTHGTLRPWKRRFGYMGLVVIAGLIGVSIRREGWELKVNG